MNEQQSPPEPEPANIENVDEEAMPVLPQGELPFPEKEIDLNEVFPEEESDLNDLFPDQETRMLLKKVQRNKKDLHTMTHRFVDEDWSGDEDGPAADEEPAEPS